MEEVNLDPPKPMKKKKAVTGKRKGQATREGGGKGSVGGGKKRGGRCEGDRGGEAAGG